MVINNKIHTKGIAYSRGKYLYYGGLTDNELNGYGYMYCIDNIYIKGNYVNGKLNGQILMYNMDKKLIFDGRWDNGDFKIGFHL